MSYRHQNQSLEDPIDKILSGFNDLETSIQNRTESGDWKAVTIREE